VPNVTVEDDQGNTYAELQNGDGVPQWIGYLRTVKPRNPRKAIWCSTLRRRTISCALPMRTKENPAYVDIPLSFGAEIPPAELPAPGPRRSDSTRSLAPCQCSQRQLRAEAVVSIDGRRRRVRER